MLATDERLVGRDVAGEEQFFADRANRLGPQSRAKLDIATAPPARRIEKKAPQVVATCSGGAGAPYGNRTRVSAVKGRRPRPLDEGRARRRGRRRGRTYRAVATGRQARVSERDLKPRAALDANGNRFVE